MEWKLVKSARCSWWLCQPLVFPWQKLLGLFAEWVTGDLGCSYCTYTPQLCWSLGGVSLKQVFWAGEMVGHSGFPFQARGILSRWGVLSSAKPWWDQWCRQNQAIFLSFLCDYSQVIFLLLLFSPIPTSTPVLLKFLKRTPDLSQSCFWSRYCLYYANSKQICPLKGVTIFQGCLQYMHPWKDSWKQRQVMCIPTECAEMWKTHGNLFPDNCFYQGNSLKSYLLRYLFYFTW